MCNDHLGRRTDPLLSDIAAIKNTRKKRAKPPPPLDSPHNTMMTTTNNGGVCKDFPDYGAASTTTTRPNTKKGDETEAMDDVELAEQGASPSPTKKEPEDIVVPGDQAAETADETKQQSCCSPAKLLIGLLLVAFVAFVIIDSLTTGYVKTAVSDFLVWIETNVVAGIFLFIMVYFIATVFFIPGSLLTLGSGFVFASAFGLGPGVALGTLVVFVGASTGALAAFLLGRYLLRDAVGRLSNKYAVFQALDQALIGNGLKIFVLLRLSPIVPFSILNYVGGVTAVSLRDYALAMFAILPGTILYVFLGASAGSLADNAEGSGMSPTVTIIVVVVGVVLGVAAIYLTTRYARKELNRIMVERNQAQADGETKEEAADEENPMESSTIMGDNDEAATK
jgi:uncharacterized membrane protein YdjX (TVP38/TMEM64 family)